ncbi:hypothetical protein RHOER0001_4584 [Rhodococcus erythropolis SK121]|nr:hypothetical protein RHOER0001_4584 [Rhodococcus erythropolis SK121]
MAHVVLDWFRHTPAMIEKIVLISTEMCTPHAPTTSTGRGSRRRLGRRTTPPTCSALQ